MRSDRASWITAVIGFSLTGSFACTSASPRDPHPSLPASSSPQLEQEAGSDPRAPSPDGAPGEKDGLAGGSAVSADGTYRATWSPRPSPIPLNEPFALQVAIEPLDRSMTGQIDLRVDARMPEHFHGMNRTPKVMRAGEHTFEVEGLLFHMSGRWVLHFDIQQEGVTERAQAEVFLP